MKNIFPTRPLKQFGRADEGQALVLTALGLMVLLLMAGLGLDVGYLRYEKQQMQKAADAAALAGASTKLYGGNYVAAGKNDAQANGFTDGTNGITVAINNPPTKLPFSTAPDSGNYVEAIVSQAQPTFFMRVGGFNTVNVAATAVASTEVTAPACLYVMDPNKAAAYTAVGGAQIQAACGLQINSTNPNAYNDNGSACTKTSYTGVVGGIESTQPCDTAPSTGISGFSDPLAGLAEPTVGQIPQSCTVKNEHVNSGQVVTLQQGTYCGGITIDGGANVTFSSGLYILYGGGMTVNSTSIINGSGVTFYNTGDKNGTYGFRPISINGVSNSSLSAPTSGTYIGILFFEDRTIPKNGNINNTINGGSGTTFDGTLYFLTSNLNYVGNSSANGYTIIIADTLSLAGTSYFGDNYTSLGGIGPVHTSQLVE